jgi:hypothetical protein
MNRRFYILALAIALCCLVIFTIFPALRSAELYKTHIKKENQQVYITDRLPQKKNAFATVVCDPQLVSVWCHYLFKQ